MAGPFAHLCTGPETIEAVLADAEAHGYVSVAAEARWAGSARILRVMIHEERGRRRRGRPSTGIALGLAWRAYRARAT